MILDFPVSVYRDDAELLCPELENSLFIQTSQIKKGKISVVFIRINLQVLIKHFFNSAGYNKISLFIEIMEFL
ncbi:MAG: hypothetical protein DWQ44_10285 [Bacteroidetes bacterium]|nr:MAG: hypothetical protein DWQ33_10565 [Bacteroidota bacterium]REK06662.1 MAG: hypothetical protein DWQ39_04075 [Bacteroidota bacterium]REK33428.1 MAG: hypothetical protein DWQ44_10285 [Bacteroidota bacterium]REK49827.1 MAG: hypothetical protein DWQ48_06840 [Bacteroidota bacterium]